MEYLEGARWVDGLGGGNRYRLAPRPPSASGGLINRRNLSATVPGTTRLPEPASIRCFVCGGVTNYSSDDVEFEEYLPT